MLSETPVIYKTTFCAEISFTFFVVKQTEIKIIVLDLKVSVNRDI